MLFRSLRYLGVAMLLAPIAEVACAAEPPEIVDVELGLGGQYKLGAWAPLRVTVAGGAEPVAVSVVAIAPDPDGVGVATTPPAGRPLSTEPGCVTETVLYTRVGKANAPLEVRLMQGRKRLDRRVVEVGSAGADERIEINPVTAATGRLILELGPAAGVGEFIRRSSVEIEGGVWSDAAPAFARVDDVAALPLDALGYDGFDAVVLAAGRSRWLAGLTSSDPRIAALERWVRGGGRIVVSCGAAGAELLTGDGPLAPFVPGRFDRLAALPRVAGIERYAESGDEREPIGLEGGDLQVSRLADTTGAVEAYDGRDPAALPLVVRAPLGFGEVTFVAFDLDHPAIAGWKGRADLVRRLLGRRFEQRADDSGEVAYRGKGAGTDYVTLLTRRLDNAFTGVGATPFMAVVGLVLLYLLLIGPGDYFLVTRVIGRVEATWVTFPLIVVMTSIGAYAAARWLKGDDLLVNQVEIVDVDTIEGRVRGTLVTHLFSPIADRYDLALAARTLDGAPVDPDGEQTAWLGKPGYGLGGMATPAASRVGWRPDYAVDPTPPLSPATGGARASVLGLPIQVWSTKTLISIWSADAGRSINAEIYRNEDGLAEGRLTNDTGKRLHDCRLVYGDWVLKIGDLNEGGTAEVVSSGSSLVRRSTFLGALNKEMYQQVGAFVPINALAQSLAFEGGADVASRREPAGLGRCDLAHHLDAGRALLLARVAEPRSELLRDGAPLVADASKRNSWVYARFVLPVAETD